nr:helix-turn-helix domain-containing protein [Clostridia bacterium]
MDNDFNKTGKVLRVLRAKYNISQESLAQRLHVTRQAVSRWEMGCTTPNPETLKDLSSMFGVTVGTLLGSEKLPEISDKWNCYDWYEHSDADSLKTNTKTEESDMSEKKKLRIGVFGGSRGKSMMHILLNHPDAELVAVCDKYVPLLDEAKKAAAECGIEIATFEKFEDFVEYDMDAVVLANYANEHAVYAVKCMNKGLHVMSEVLPCENMAQAVELIETVERTGLVYAYAENYCYMRHAFEMWQKYKSGEMGYVTYGEGEYVHDCSAIWPRITYGERNHWRNRMHANFYCTHSLGPLLTMTGLRPVSVVGFEIPAHPDMVALGSYAGAAGIEMVTLENGAVLKSIHGGLKREPGSINYELYCSKGMMETGRLAPLKQLNVYKEGDKLCHGSWEQYDPEPRIAKETAEKFPGHGGSDFFPTHFFIEKILGRPDGEWSIDVYTAVDMGICGILAYRSVLNGNARITVPNLRNPEERDAYRNDTACTNPAIAGDQLLPCTSFGEPDISDEAYDRVRQLWLDGKNAE